MIFLFKEDAIFLIQPSESHHVKLFHILFSLLKAHKGFLKHGSCKYAWMSGFWLFNSGTRKDSSCIFLCSSWFTSQNPGIWYTCEKIHCLPFYFTVIFFQTNNYLILTLNNKENLESKNVLPNSEKKGNATHNKVPSPDLEIIIKIIERETQKSYGKWKVNPLVKIHIHQSC